MSSFDHAHDVCNSSAKNDVVYRTTPFFLFSVICGRGYGNDTSLRYRLVADSFTALPVACFFHGLLTTNSSWLKSMLHRYYLYYHEHFRCSQSVTSRTFDIISFFYLFIYSFGRSLLFLMIFVVYMRMRNVYVRKGHLPSFTP